MLADSKLSFNIFLNSLQTTLSFKFQPQCPAFCGSFSLSQSLQDIPCRHQICYRIRLFFVFARRKSEVRWSASDIAAGLGTRFALVKDGDEKISGRKTTVFIIILYTQKHRTSKPRWIFRLEQPSTEHDETCIQFARKFTWFKKIDTRPL